MRATRTTIVALLVIGLTFVAGMAAGMFTSHMMILYGLHGAPVMPTRATVHRLDRRLDLSDTQRKQVEEIVRRRHARIEQMWANVRPEMRAEIEQTNAEIARVLTPEQREKFERMKFHLGARHEKRRSQ